MSVEYLAIGKTNEEEQSYVENKVVSETRKIIGYILLGVGLITAVLGVVVFKELLYLAAALILAGILCIVVKKHFGIIFICVFAGLFCIVSPFIVYFGTMLFTIMNTVLLVLFIILIVKVIKKVLQK